MACDQSHAKSEANRKIDSERSVVGPRSANCEGDHARFEKCRRRQIAASCNSKSDGREGWKGKDPMKFDAVQNLLFERVPEVWEPFEEKFGQDYDLGAESSGEYPLFEDVVREYMLRILLSQQDEKALTRLFGFFEKMARSSDPEITNLLRLTILRPLVYKPEYDRIVQKYTGKRHANLSIQRDSFETVDDDSQVDSVDCRFAVGESLEGPGDRTG